LPLAVILNLFFAELLVFSLAISRVVILKKGVMTITIIA